MTAAGLVSRSIPVGRVRLPHLSLLYSLATCSSSLGTCYSTLPTRVALSSIPSAAGTQTNVILLNPSALSNLATDPPPARESPLINGIALRSGF